MVVAPRRVQERWVEQEGQREGEESKRMEGSWWRAADRSPAAAAAAAGTEGSPRWIDEAEEQRRWWRRRGRPWAQERKERRVLEPKDRSWALVRPRVCGRVSARAIPSDRSSYSPEKSLGAMKSLDLLVKVCACLIPVGDGVLGGGVSVPHAHLTSLGLGKRLSLLSLGLFVSSGAEDVGSMSGESANGRRDVGSCDRAEKSAV